MQIDSANRQIVAKIVYYGPGRGGKTTNLQRIHESHPKESRSRLLTVPNKEDRTLFFDLFALDYGEINGYTLRFQLVTVPGQVRYNATRKLVLRGVDGIVFVADSTPDKVDANLESMQNLYDNLTTMEIDPRRLRDSLDLPMVLQFNKRDAPGALSPSVMQEHLNYDALPAFEAVALQGHGVFETLHEILTLTARSIQEKI